MRERIIEMNGKLNKMLDKYELLSGASKKPAIRTANPHKYLPKEIELNNRIIEKQKYHIKKVADSLFSWKKKIRNWSRRITL